LEVFASLRSFDLDGPAFSIFAINADRFNVLGFARSVAMTYPNYRLR